MNKKGEWRISPAYDITFAYHPDNKWISRHQMTINGKAGEITDEDMIACGVKMGLTNSFCREVIKSARDVVSNWLQYAEKAFISEGRAVDIALAIEAVRNVTINGITSEQRNRYDS